MSTIKFLQEFPDKYDIINITTIIDITNNSALVVAGIGKEVLVS